MLSLRDPSPRLAQATQSLFTPSGSPRCKDEPSTPRELLLSPLQNAINTLPAAEPAAVKTEGDSTDTDNTMERRNEAGGSQSRSNNQYVYTGQTSFLRLFPDRSHSPRPPNPQEEADAELARLLQEEIERAAAGNAPESAPVPPHLPPLTLQGFGMQPVRPPQQGFVGHPFPAVPFSSMASWPAYEPQAYAELEQFLRQTDAHRERPLEANQQNPFFPPPPVASPLTPVSQHSRGMSQASSAPSGNDSSTADHSNSRRAERPRTQAEINAAMIAEEKRRRNTAASGKVENSSSSRIEGLWKVNWNSQLASVPRRNRRSSIWSVRYPISNVEQPIWSGRRLN